MFHIDLNMYNLRDDVHGYLDVAFIAFCKDCRSEPLTRFETNALAFCGEMCLFPLKPAVFDLTKPFPEYDKYSCAPPDVLHTEEGGQMKDWIFNSTVIISCVGTKGHGNGNNINTLDRLVAQCPIIQSMPFYMRRFTLGVTPYVRTASKGSKSKKGLFTYILFLSRCIFLLYKYIFIILIIQQNRHKY